MDVTVGGESGWKASLVPSFPKVGLNCMSAKWFYHCILVCINLDFGPYQMRQM